MHVSISPLYILLCHIKTSFYFTKTFFKTCKNLDLSYQNNRTILLSFCINLMKESIKKTLQRKLLIKLYFDSTMF